jgi:acyl-CoA thioester hydrolase
VSTKPQPQPRSAYRLFRPIGTRWSDNDVYGHINNVAYFSYFDTAVNSYLISAGAIDIHAGATIGLVVQTHCDYFSPLEFPQTLEAGLRVSQRGTSSVRYEIGLFAQGAELSAAAGHFVHVYVDRATRRPAALSTTLKTALLPLLEIA